MITNFNLFENIDEVPFKKYVVWLQNKGTFNDCFIYEILDYIKYTNSVKIRLTYGYWQSESEPSSFVKMEELKNHVEYTSDCLQYCIDIIPSLKNSIKYNL